MSTIRMTFGVADFGVKMPVSPPAPVELSAEVPLLTPRYSVNATSPTPPQSLPGRVEKPRGSDGQKYVGTIFPSAGLAGVCGLSQNPPQGQSFCVAAFAGLSQSRAALYRFSC